MAAARSPLKTPLARPVPNKKALEGSTSSNGETGELVAQIGLAHGQRRGCCAPQNSFVNLMVQLGPSESSTAEKEPKKKTAPINIHLKREIETLRRKNEQMQAKIRAVSNPVDRTEGGGPPTAPTIKTNWSRYWTSCDSLTSISPSMQPCYCVNCKRKQNRQTVSQVVEHVSRVTPRLRFQSFGRFSNANGLPTMPCLSSDATATPSMGSCLSLNDTATPSMKSCLSPPILSAQSTHSMVTCLTSDGHPMEPEIPENGIPDPGWTSPMVVTAISSLPIPPQVPCGTQTEEQPTTSARGPRFKTEKRRTRLARGRAKSARKLRAALNVMDANFDSHILAANCPTGAMRHPERGAAIHKCPWASVKDQEAEKVIQKAQRGTALVQENSGGDGGGIPVRRDDYCTVLYGCAMRN
ncbi:uncharacterized protein LOC111071619 [Drosophila obscura]|uniref:uncharacterized protein LOC111071619 n=1 Tax=Drosophila obscura TaxID=7282 RepID=UPI001BB16A5B|nr:uncharacterized protein LOC111071619 [Drosophila obscura]